MDRTRYRNPLLIASCLALALTAFGAAAAAHAATSAPASTATAAAQAPIDINTAKVADLVKLPGIGEALAKRIVEFRQQHGPFKRVEDLMKVKGIGEKSFEKLRPSIVVGSTRSK